MVTQPHKAKPSLTQLSIRRMQPKDVSGVMTIESVSFGAHHWSEEAFYNEMKNYVAEYYVLTDESQNTKVLGYAGIWIILDECHVTTIAVAPEYRGSSFGELLFSHALQRCMDSCVKWLTLEVRVSNAAGQNLYYKYGMETVNIRPKYYQDNKEDALIMTTQPIQTDAYQALYKTRKLKLFERLQHIPKGFGLP